MQIAHDDKLADKAGKKAVTSAEAADVYATAAENVVDSAKTISTNEPITIEI